MFWLVIKTKNIGVTYTTPMFFQAPATTFDYESPDNYQDRIKVIHNETNLPKTLARLLAAGAIGRTGHHRDSGARRAAEPDAADLAGQEHRGATAARFSAHAREE